MPKYRGFRNSKKRVKNVSNNIAKFVSIRLFKIISDLNKLEYISDSRRLAIGFKK